MITYALTSRPKLLPRQHADEHGQQQQRIEEEDGFLRLEQRAEEAHMKRSSHGYFAGNDGFNIRASRANSET